MFEIQCIFNSDFYVFEIQCDQILSRSLVDRVRFLHIIYSCLLSVFHFILDILQTKVLQMKLNVLHRFCLRQVYIPRHCQYGYCNYENYGKNLYLFPLSWFVITKRLENLSNAKVYKKTLSVFHLWEKSKCNKQNVHYKNKPLNFETRHKRG